MKRRPIIERREPDADEARRSAVHRLRLNAYVRDCIDRAVRECDFAKPIELGREFIAAGARVVEGAQDGPGAASALGVAIHRLSPALPRGRARRAADAQLAGGRR